MDVLYTSNSCTSCRKAKVRLMEQNISFVERNIHKDLLTKEEIINLLSLTSYGTSELMSKRSKEGKSLEEDDSLPLQKWMEKVISEPGILRRPLLKTKERLIVGYNKEEYDTILKKKI
jgi:regulatory protein spx